MATARKQPPSVTEFDSLSAQVDVLRQAVHRFADSHADLIRSLPSQRQASAHNLLCYLALRQHDLRSLQDRLAHLGLSSIGRAESNVLATLTAVSHNLKVLRGDAHSGPCSAAVYSVFDELEDRLEQNTARLLGQSPEGRRAYILVTMPDSAADDFMMIHQLVNSGMDCIRINSAHGDCETWGRIIEQKQYAERVAGKKCPVLIDLRGPKMRTGPMQDAPAVLKIRPRRDRYGKVVRPARIWLTGALETAVSRQSADACLALQPEWLSNCNPGDKVLLKDARGSKRRWVIRETTPSGCWAESAKTTYVVNGTKLRLRGFDYVTRVAGLPCGQSEVILRKGDLLEVCASEEPGRPAFLDEDGTQLTPGRVSVPVPEIYRDARPGEPMSFDDGRIVGTIEKRSDQQLNVRITHTRKPVEKLGPDKGLNLPETALNLPALSGEDIRDLPFIARHADMIGLSFTNRASDVRELRQRLQELCADHVGVVVKIETKRGFARLPAILIEALRFPACGVMIARGDLAAECGFERMAELQQEILWICESAHVPVIWATQVLEGLAKRGHASRAEISDASMSQSAECVMLNKGPYIIDAVRTLDDILRRMQDHQSKKRSMLRRLHLDPNITA